VVVEKSRIQDGSIVRHVSRPKPIFRARLFENPLSQVSRDRRLRDNRRFSAESRQVPVVVTAEVGSEDEPTLARLLDAILGQILKSRAAA